MTSRGTLAIALGLAAVLMSSCQRPAPDTNPDTAAMQNAGASSEKPALIGPTWTLVELAGQPAPLGNGDRPATLIIQDDAEPRASGLAGCNRWSSQYTHTAPDRIQFTAPLSTKMACPAGMELERRFLEMITATRGYALSDSGLALRGEGGVHARFVAR